MPNFDVVLLTPEGKEKLEKELDELLKRRPAIVEEVQKARAQGDLKENSAYQAGRENMRNVDRRILRLKLTLRKGKVVENTNDGTVQLGSKVKLYGPNGEITYAIVGQNEASPKDGKISHVSPLGKILLNKKANEEVKLITPMGEIKYEILKVS
jgi:transcription elongation factor GreA